MKFLWQFLEFVRSRRYWIGWAWWSCIPIRSRFGSQISLFISFSFFFFPFNLPFSEFYFCDHLLATGIFRSWAATDLWYCQCTGECWCMIFSLILDHLFSFLSFFLLFFLFLSRLGLVQVLSRKAKNRYSWKGIESIPQALEELKVIISLSLSLNLDYVFAFFFFFCLIWICYTFWIERGINREFWNCSCNFIWLPKGWLICDFFDVRFNC